jgi:Domain of unknown function (DUF4126)
MSHTAKAGTRAIVNASPEPFSNIAVSTGEDVAAGGLLFTVLANPGIAIVIAVGLLILAVYAIFTVRRMLKRIFGQSSESAAT